MKKKLLISLAVGAAFYLVYLAANGGLVAGTAAVTVVSTLWLGWLAAFVKRPREPLPFFTAYPRHFYLAAYVSLVSGVTTLLCTGSAVFLFFSLVACTSLVLQWWRPVSEQKAKERK